MKQLFLIFFLSFFAGGLLYAQNAPKTAPQDSTQQVELLQATELEGFNEPGNSRRYIKSDSLHLEKVIFKHENALLYCNSALQYVDSNRIEAVGDILIEEGDSITVKGDSLFYDGNTRFARIRGNVIMSDSQMVLTTTAVDYDMALGIAYYNVGGKVVDEANVLTSKKGYYDMNSKVFSFKDNVKLVNAESDYKLDTDTLTYNTVSEKAFFHSLTKIKSREGNLQASQGEYDTRYSKSKFFGRAQIETEDMILEGDFLDYDEILETGEARDNVRMFDKKDSVTVYGDRAFRYGMKNYSKVIGNAMLERRISDKDTLFIAADTLISIDDTLANNKRLYAYPKVRIFTGSLQGICDSLSYDFVDSAIYLLKSPVLWSENSQITADSILLTLKNNRPDSAFLNSKAMVVSEDFEKDYNQIKGRSMKAKFRDDALRELYVYGNGQSIYFAIDEKKRTLSGMNKIDCSRMTILFGDSSKLLSMMFITKPTAKFYPPQLIPEKEEKLEDFKWLPELKPEKKDLPIHKKTKTLQIKREETKEIPAEWEKILAGAEKVYDLGFELYYTPEKLIFFKRNIQELDSNTRFTADLFPKNTQDLPEKRRERKYETLDFQIPPASIQNGSLLYELSLPAYPLYTIRAGQKRLGYADVEKPFYLWETVFNIYDLKKTPLERETKNAVKSNGFKNTPKPDDLKNKPNPAALKRALLNGN